MKERGMINESGRTFYKMRLVPNEDGLCIKADSWISIRETPCLHYCVPESEIRSLKAEAAIDEKTLFEVAKNKKYCKRVHKSNSRIAFPTEQEALENLRFLKRRQLMHMERDQKFIKQFLSDTEDKSINDFQPTAWGDRLLPNTEVLVRQYFVFD